MFRSSSLVIFSAALALGAAPAAAMAQTADAARDPTQLALNYMTNDPFLVLTVFLTAVLVLGKTLDLVRSIRKRRQEPVEEPSSEMRPIEERLHSRSGGRA